METEKEYEGMDVANSEWHHGKRTDMLQSLAQSDELKQQKRRDEVMKHNVPILKEYFKGEEGIDQYDPAKDPRYFNAQKFKRDVKTYLNKLKLTNPEKAKQEAEFLFKKNWLDEIVDGTLKDLPDIDEIIKVYPGSPKGPRPEDDPEHYSKWFMRNYPVEHLHHPDD